MEILLNGELWGWLSLAWCILCFGWAVLRGHGLDAAIYGIALTIGVIISLNIGGVLNAESWHLFSLLIFGVEFLYNFATHHQMKMLIFGILLFASAILGW